VTLFDLLLFETLSNSHSSGNAAHIVYNMFTHESESVLAYNCTFPVKNEGFSRSHAVTYAVKMIDFCVVYNSAFLHSVCVYLSFLLSRTIKY